MNSKVINEILKQSIKSYKYINAVVPHLINEITPLSLHNQVVSDSGKNISPDTFEGKYACGATCYTLHHMLKHYGIETKMMFKSIGSGDYYQDHCFLIHNSIIIDPTYKQFFTEYVKEKNTYTDVLFNENPFVFVGSLNSMKAHFYSLQYVHKKNYGMEIDISTSDFWENAVDKSSKLKDRRYLSGIQGHDIQLSNDI